jgi:myo-inositol-1(or 4)-monophosphatase
MARTALLNVMVNAAMKAGRGLARDFGEVANLQVSVKGPGDFVSSADRKAEDVIRAELQKARPDFGLLMEESGTIKGRDPQNRWIVDPLDGTTNFLHGIPVFGISIALEREGQIVAGVIYNPAMDELYVAERGQGAFMNDRRLRVAGRRDLTDCVIGTGIPHLGRGDHVLFMEQQRRMMLEVSGIRRFGAAALDLAYVASGRLDGFWEHGLSPWDIAAGLIIIREAGGFATDFDGGPGMFESGRIVAGNEAIHGKLRQVLAEAGAGRA